MMKNLTIRLVSALVLTIFALAPAAAETFKLTYTFSFGNVLEADIEGELQADGDTVVVTAVKNARLDDNPGAPLKFITSLADLVDNTNTNKPVLTLSGKNNDISMCSTKSCTGEFVTFDGVKQFLGRPGIYTSVSYGHTMSGGRNADEVYEEGRYRLVRE
ncbi:MAG: hypothetical protein AAF468_22060 [Pseudomonadota bacterium]